MKKWSLLFAVVLMASNACAEEEKSPMDLVRDGDQYDPAVNNVIDPDGAIFGALYGMTENEFIKEYGNPTGYIRLRGKGSGMLYGKSHLFFFKDKKLNGIRITSNILDWKISRGITDYTKFDGVRWELKNGLKEGMDRAQVKKILGDRLKKQPHGYQYYYDTDKSRVELDFSHYVNAGEEDEAYRLHGIAIRKKHSQSLSD